MSKSLFVKITQGISIGPYSIYYNLVQPNNYAFLYGTTTNASNVPLSALTSGNGVRITIPNEATSVLIENANGDCLNYKTFSIAEFKSVTSACTGFYAGTATINVVIDGDDDLYQYSRDGGVTFSESTAEKSYTFTNVPNGNHNIAVKNVSDGVTISYESNPVVLDCAPAIVATFLTNCYFIPPSDELVGIIGISATGGSSPANLRYAIKQLPSGTKTEKRVNNTFGNLDGTGQYEMYVYDNGNTVNPNYELVVGTTTFTCPNPPPPVTFTTTVACASTGYVGTGSVVADNFAGGSGQYIYLAFGTSEQQVRDILADDTVTTPRITLTPQTQFYRWRDLNNGTYFVGLQDSDSRITVVETAPVSCTNIEPPIKQFLAYNLITNTCNKLGVPIRRYWTYDTALADGIYKVNGDDVSIRLETVPNIQIRGFKIDSIISAPCILTNVTLTPGINFSLNQYLLLVNNTAYSEIVSGTNAFPAGSRVQLSFGAGTEICGVTLNGQPYTSNTYITLVAGTNYNFVINAVNSFVAQGAVYCEANQSKRLFVNACGTQETRIITPCSTACTSTTFTETCSGTYNENVLRTFRFVCNGALTGQTTTYTCGPCSSTTQDWKVQSYECVPNDCNLREVQKQMNPCAPAFNTTRVVNTFTVNCQCGPTCTSTPTYTEAVCGGAPTFVRTVTTKAGCTNEVISVVNTNCSTLCGASTVQEWTNSGAIQCYGTCVKKQRQVQTNACAAGFGTERFVDVGGASCDCGETCLGQETHNFCSGTDNKDLYTVQRYVCAPKSFIGTPQLLETCSSPICTTKTATYTSQGTTACYIPPTGSGNCTTGGVFRDTNRCSPTFNNYFILVGGTYQNVGSGQPTPGACNTNPIWGNNGSFACYGTCNKYNVEQNVNRCSSTFGQTRQGSLVETNTTFCGGCCGLSTAQVQGAQVGTYYTCSGGTVNSAPVFVNSNVCYLGPNQWSLNGIWISSNPSNNPPSTDPVWDNDGSPFCGTGGSLSNCQLYQKQVNTNPCSSATVRYIDQGPSNSCGTWEPYAYCFPEFNVAPYAYLTGQENTCTGDRRNQTYTENSPNCKPEELQGFPMSASGGDAITACGNEIGNFPTAYCLGGVPGIGRQIFDAPVGGSVYSDGFYHVGPGNWISITGGDGFVTSNGPCSF
jgi:hypothetical protein